MKTGPTPPVTGPNPTRAGQRPAPASPADEAARVLGELEARVASLALDAADADRAQTMVVAGRASALLGVADTAVADGDSAGRRRIAELRGRYDAALLRLGGLAVAPSRRRQGIVGSLPGSGEALGLRQIGRAVTTALMVTGLLLLCFAAYSLAFAHVTYERQQRAMLAELSADFRESAAVAAAAVAGDRDLAATPGRGEPVALLEIPKTGVREVVVQATGTRELRTAVGHYRPSPMPGQAGNAVLAGHRNLYGRPFARLGSLRPGDTVLVTTQEGRFTYTVEFAQTAPTGAQDFLSQGTFVNRLTLLTTAPRGKGGRFAVVSRLKGGPAALRIKDSTGIKTDELGLARDSSGWWPSLGWGVLMLGALVVTAILYRSWRRPSTYLLTMPVLLALALLWFESLARLIPSTF
ncbi:sortase [Actinomadura soli]|uniref:Sortase n=1 Tax=Actinomadura soli TaxID=2508997 RepID=A0A5C4JJE1_9ACTN|nr:sortase [Actinomadura soli]TMR06748.1 sortase [Actinomadura soli]